MLSKCEREIRLKDTIKKLPSYNVSFSLELSAMAAIQGSRLPDRKYDDAFLAQGEEPRAPGLDNCQSDNNRVGKRVLKIDPCLMSDTEPQLSATKSRKLTKFSKSVQQDPHISSKQEEAVKESWKLVRLNEEEWGRRIIMYGDELSDQHLDNMRKFVHKKREFQLTDAKNKKKAQSTQNPLMPVKQSGLIFENNQFIKLKRVNPDNLPVTDYCEQLNFKENTLIKAQLAANFQQKQDIVTKMKQKHARQKEINAEKQAQEEMIRNFGNRKRVIKQVQE